MIINLNISVISRKVIIFLFFISYPIHGQGDLLPHSKESSLESKEINTSITGDINELTRVSEEHIIYGGGNFCLNMPSGMMREMYKIGPGIDLDLGYYFPKIGVNCSFGLRSGTIKSNLYYEDNDYQKYIFQMDGFELGIAYPFYILENGIFSEPSFMSVGIKSGIYWYSLKNKDSEKSIGPTAILGIEYKYFYHFPLIPVAFVPSNLSVGITYPLDNKDLYEGKGFIITIKFGITYFGFI